MEMRFKQALSAKSAKSQGFLKVVLKQRLLSRAMLSQTKNEEPTK
ncbi:hypothetical protein CLV88_106149 [Shimia abyssi]|uniref:Uncharacterized protein n=1 Tax=Shimia abyssi TaxID=1662395 RepID=A0A2P8FCJ5_9RHOB|nr:hypothetical protein CLV88_106149 [Shimia abyssi]